ncbi:hypothetical protein Bca4012_010046 [Brassica carinata]
MEVLRRGRPRWLAFNPTRDAYALPPGQNRSPPIELVVSVEPGRARQFGLSLLRLSSCLLWFTCVSIFNGNREREASSENSNASSEGASSERTQVTRPGPVLRSRSQEQSPGILARPVSGSGAGSGVHRAKRRRLETIPFGPSRMQPAG